MDQHVPCAITIGLRLRGAEVITAFEDGASTMDDSQLLNRAAELGCVLFTQDDDLLAEAAKRQRASIRFHGVIYADHYISLPVTPEKCLVRKSFCSLMNTV